MTGSPTTEPQPADGGIDWTVRDGPEIRIALTAEFRRGFEAGWRNAVAALRTPEALRCVSADEECACTHGKAYHPRSVCVYGVTWTESASCPCRAYDPVTVANDPFGYAAKYLIRAADFLESTGGQP